MANEEKKIIIFGAGDYGRQAYEYYGPERVAYFTDNNENKWFSDYCGKNILSIEEYFSIQKDFQTIIAVRSYSAIARQLEDAGILDYEYYSTEYRQTVKRIEEQKKSIIDSSNLIFFGIDKSSEVLVRRVLYLAVAPKCIVYCDTKESGRIGKEFRGNRIQDYFESVQNNSTVIISSAEDSYLYGAIAEQSTCKNVRIINPFVQIRYFETDDIIFNPYLKAPNGTEDLTEEEWNEQTKKDINIRTIYKLAEILDNYHPLFNHVEIETQNRCNGKCTFCPVSVGNDIRPKASMSDELFEKIIDELSDLNYSGRLALFSNDEPLLDPQIIQRHQIAREKLPKARIHMFTNGSLLTVDKFVQLMQYLDELIIDNYNQKLELNKNPKVIAEYCENHPEYKSRTTIVLRKENEILTSRGGDAPNRTQSLQFAKERCVLPFRQLIIRPDGKVSLCCNDPYGRMTMGDINEQSIKEIWYGPVYAEVRKKIMAGRENLDHCKFCDTFYF